MKKGDFRPPLLSKQPNKMKITINQLSEITGIRPCVLNFALEMESKLKKNDHKTGWQGYAFYQLRDRLEDEVLELQEACAELEANRSKPRIKKVIKEAADVANFAMMMADNASRF